MTESRIISDGAVGTCYSKEQQEWRHWQRGKLRGRWSATDLSLESIAEVRRNAPRVRLCRDRADSRSLARWTCPNHDIRLADSWQDELEFPAPPKPEPPQCRERAL